MSAKEYQRMLRQARKRRAQILEWRKNGWTFEQIAAKLDVSKQRVHQILKAANG